MFCLTKLELSHHKVDDYQDQALDMYHHHKFDRPFKMTGWLIADYIKAYRRFEKKIML